MTVSLFNLGIIDCARAGMHVWIVEPPPSASSGSHYQVRVCRACNTQERRHHFLGGAIRFVGDWRPV